MTRGKQSVLSTMFLVYMFVHVAEVQSKATNDKIKTKTNINLNNSSNNHKEISDGNFKSSECILKISNVSKAEFTYNILKYKYNFVYLKLNIENITGTRLVIALNDWVWTYKGDNGAHQYLYIPEDFGYLSFGLLWVHTMEERMSVDMVQNGDCNELIIGKKETDKLIGDALGDMTSEIASKHGEYNSSYWCYNKRVWIPSRFLYELCKNSICTFQTIEYVCCKFSFDYVIKKRTIKCQREHYHYGAIWWILPIITGNICFAFFPLMLTKIGMKFRSLSKSMKKERSISLTISSFHDTVDSQDNYVMNKSMYLSLKSPNPVTVFSTLFSPFYGLVLKSSRVLRIWIIIAPMCLSAIHVLLDYVYANDFMVSAVLKGALVGFSAILAGANEARKTFLYVIGGPMVATSICFLYGCLLIVLPAKLEDFVASGISGHKEKFIFVIKMPLKLKQKISGINVRHTSGCKKLHRLFLAQIFMLFHSKFWRQSMKLFCLRWKNVIFLRMYNTLENTPAVMISCAIIFPFYLTFCMFELLFAILFYLFPVINIFLIILNSVRIIYYDCLNQRGIASRCVRRLLFIPILVLFLISWYTYSITFFDGFWFLSRIVMFTYSGIVAYPHLSYGYLVLALMTIFYVTESINAFGQRYKDLLKLSLESCEKVQQKHMNDNDIDQEEIKSIRTKYGIKTELFYEIINKNLPKRIQLLLIILKLSFVISVLVVSVELLATFDKFKELSLLMHVFTVLFVCALPKIVYMVCRQSRRDRTHLKLKHKVYRTIVDFVRNKNSRNSTSDKYDSDLVSGNSDYEFFPYHATDNSDTDMIT